MSIVIVATFFPKSEFREEVVAAIETTIPLVHANDPGCELYAMHQAPDRVVMIEKWASPEDLGAHGKGEALSTLMAQVDGKLTQGLDVQFLTPHPTGTDEQGVL
jgi:quinol monooxygenase YgiN